MNRPEFQWKREKYRLVFHGGPLDGSAQDLDGSWVPVDVWAKIGGRVYSTALCTLSLEVYYRYLPMYR